MRTWVVESMGGEVYYRVVVPETAVVTKRRWRFKVLRFCGYRWPS